MEQKTKAPEFGETIKPKQMKLIFTPLPGAIFTRCGRRYVVMPDGSQRRVAQDVVKKQKFGGKER